MCAVSRALRCVRLELDGVGARLGRDVDEPECGIEIAIVIGAGFSDDVARVTRPHRPVSDLEFPIAVGVGAHE